MIEFARDRLHRVGVEPVRLEHDRQRIAGKFPFREHVEREEAAFHAASPNIVGLVPERPSGMSPGYTTSPAMTMLLS